MSQYKTRFQLKMEARERLTGHYGFFIGAMLFMSITSYLVSSLFSGFVSTTTTTGYIFYEVISGIIIIFMGLFSVGSSLAYLKCACRSPFSFQDLFYGFQHNQNQGLVVSLAINAVNLLTIPVNLYALNLYQQTGSYLTMCYAYLGGMFLVEIIAFFIQLFLMPCFYLLLDYPGKSAGAILKLSLQIMKTHWCRFFVLELSFIPLLLIGVLSLIGILWVIPYRSMTTTLFYLDIMKPEQKV